MIKPSPVFYTRVKKLHEFSTVCGTWLDPVYHSLLEVVRVFGTSSISTFIQLWGNSSSYKWYNVFQNSHHRKWLQVDERPIGNRIPPAGRDGSATVRCRHSSSGRVLNELSEQDPQSSPDGGLLLTVSCVFMVLNTDASVGFIHKVLGSSGE